VARSEIPPRQLLAARDAQSVVADLTQQTFENSRTAQLAAEHALQIIGDAASRLSQETRDGHPEISWSEMIGLRNDLSMTTVTLTSGSSGMYSTGTYLV
jgi:uncharacterized protein with HEPN domain